MSIGDPPAAVRLRDVSVVFGDRVVLDRIDWEVRPGQRWVVLGRNGSGKTTLVRLASGRLHPSAGEVDLLGERVGRTDLRALRPRIGLTSAALLKQLRPGLGALDAVITAKHAALEAWWHTYDEADRLRATKLLAQLGVAHVADQELGTLSSGEGQRVLLARTLMTDPGLLLLDEPTAGLDLGGREELVAALAALARDPASPPIVLVTHHVDEIPPGFTHALLLRAGRRFAAGPLDEVLTAAHLSDCFGIPLRLERRGDRFSGWAE